MVPDEPAAGLLSARGAEPCAGWRGLPEQVSGGTRLRIATYNIHAGVGNDGRFDAARIVAVLREMDAEVVALQEVEHRPVADTDLLDYLARATRSTAIAGPTLQREVGHYGNALLTRLPVLQVSRVDLSLPRHEPRGAIDVTLEWQGQRAQVVATHLGLRPYERRQQTRRLLALLEAGKADLAVLLGDLNEWLLWGRPLRWLRRHFSATPYLRTYPAFFPLFALDRIWVSPRAALAGIATHDSRLARLASDHLPLTAEISMALLAPPARSTEVTSR